MVGHVGSIRSLLVLIAVLAVIASLLSGTSVEAAPTPVTTTSKPSPNKNTKPGDASERGKALAKARKSKKQVEVTSEQTTTTSVFANPDGTISQEKAAAPIRAKDSTGKLAPIDTELTENGSALEPKVTTGEVAFSSTGDGALATYEVADGESVSLSFGDGLGAPAVDGSEALYPVEGSTTEEVRVASLRDGFVSHVVLSQAPKDPPTYTFTLKLDGLSAELKNNRLQLSNSDGKVVAESRPFQMWDAARDSAGDPSNTQAVDAKLVDGANGTAELQLTPSIEYLSNPNTQYPVTIDPDVLKVEHRGDTYYFNGQAPTDPRGSDYKLITGYDNGATHRSLVTFGYDEYIGQTVTKATLRLRQYSSETCTPKENELFPIKADVAGPITWDTRPEIEDTARFRTSNTSNHGQSGDGCPDDFEDFNVTPQVSAWAGGTLDSDTAGLERQGIELRAASENDGSYEKRFCSINESGSDDLNCNSSAYYPVLSVTYAPELGTEEFFSMTDLPLNDKSSLAINNKAGNALVTANDANVNSVGMPFSLSRAYNSQSPYTTSLGKGWNLGIGPDVWIEKHSKYRYNYHAPDGTHFGSFVRKTADSGSDDYDNFISPLGGVGAELNQDYDGNGSTDSSNDPDDPDQFNLTMHDSQMDYEFEEQVSTGHAYLAKVTDRSGNTMNLAYSGTTSTGTPKLDSVTDTAGRTYTFTYTGDHITSVTEGGGLGRTWRYGYDGDYLTSYTDPDGKVTTYTYESRPGPGAPDMLESITDPTNPAGTTPRTKLTYGNDRDLNVEEVTTVDRVLSDTITYRYTWDYHSSEDHTPVCESHGDFSTEVFDPNGHPTTYCYKPREEDDGKAKEWVYDGEERERTTEYNIDRQSEILTQGATGSTVKSYASSVPDQLKTVTNPKSSSSTSGGRTHISYDHDHTGGGADDPKGEDWIPASVTDPNGDCTRYEYDSKGRPTAAITKLRGSGTDRSCADDFDSGVKYTFVYNSDGTLAKSNDANTQSPASDADRTIYTYWAAGDADFVAGTKGLIKSIRKPGGSCATDTGRKLCTSYTYDAAGRVKTVKDGKGTVTTMAYDKLDRTTTVYLNGASNCDNPANCVTYTYDTKGNLTERNEAAGKTEFTYDNLNRQTEIKQPPAATGAVMTMSYDGVSNLTQYAQSIGGTADPVPVTYTYDAGNMISSITDAAGTIDTEVDDDANLEEIRFPGPTGVEVGYEIDDDGKAKSAVVKGDRGAGSTKYQIAYDYTDGSDDEDQLQSRVVSNAPSGLNGTANYEYEYGRLASVSDSSSAGRSYTYTHDNIGNVASETRTSTTTHFGYDRAGQLCYKGPTDGFSTASNCGTPPAGATTFSHDAAGNNLNTATNPTSYNTRNQVTNLGGMAMKYLDLGNDLRTDAAGDQLVEGPLGITGRKNTDGITWYTRMPDGTILNSRKGSTTQNYFTEPHNRTVAALFSPSGTTTATYVYSPYGDTTVHTGGSVADENPFRYISGFQDTAGTEDYYKLGARFYDGHGHFTQPDPNPGSIDKPNSMTAYSYGGGDPVNHSDPTGRDYLGPCWIAVDFNLKECAKQRALAVVGCAVGGVAFSSKVLGPLINAMLSFYTKRFAPARLIAAIGCGLGILSAEQARAYFGGGGTSW